MDIKLIKQKVQDNSITLVDVREIDEWDEGHVKEAVHVPLSQLRNGILPDNLDKTKPAYLYCRSGQRVFYAAPILASAGFEVVPMQEGFESLMEWGFNYAE